MSNLFWAMKMLLQVFGHSSENKSTTWLVIAAQLKIKPAMEGGISAN